MAVVLIMIATAINSKLIPLKFNFILMLKD
jgi:hypothetical protein